MDAYVNFARTKPWPVAIASSLTELFAPDLMKRRLAAFEKFYSWIDPRGLDYFRRRTIQARYDSNEALAITLEYCNTPELQREAVRALELNETAQEILSRCNGRTFNEIVRALAEEYDSDVAALAADVRETLTDLHQRKLIELT